MRKWIIGIAALAVLLTFGCGPESKIADKPTDEQIRMDQEEQKKVELEERGTPIKGKKK